MMATSDTLLAKIDDKTGDILISTVANLATPKTIVVKATATATDKYNKPDDATYTLTVNPAPEGVGTPEFSQTTGSYYYGTTFTISSANSEKIYYTTDGTTPSKTNGTLYSGAIAITSTVTVKAIGYDGETASEVASATYTLLAPEVPTFSVAAGGVTAGTSLTLTMGDGGTKVVYTTDGTTPTTSSTTYSSALTINYPTTVKAATVDAGNNLSAVVTNAYTIVVYKEDVLWEENFSDFKADAIPSEGTYSYTCENGKTTTKVYSDNLAGGTAPEILVSNNNGYFQATIPLDNVSGNLTLTYKTNNANLEVTTTTDGISLSGDTTPQGSKNTSTVTVSGVTIAMKSLVIKFVNSKSSNCRLDDIKLTCNKQFATETASLSSVGYATYASANALDLSDVDGLTAYTASVSESVVTFNEVTGTVPAETGLLLKGDAGSYNIPVVESSSTDVTGNKLVGKTAVTTIGKKTGDDYNYVLKDGADGVGFYQVNNDAYKVRANSAYLAIPYDAASGGAKLFIGLDDATGLEEVMGMKVTESAPVYNLQGQRVENGYRGIVIVNGKKVIR